MTKNISINLLKHISPSAFLEKYWGKQALFLQDAIIFLVQNSRKT